MQIIFVSPEETRTDPSANSLEGRICAQIHAQSAQNLCTDIAYQEGRPRRRTVPVDVMVEELDARGVQGIQVRANHVLVVKPWGVVP